MDPTKYLIFDCETTGLPKNYKARMSDLDNWPRVIQLAWAEYSANGEKLKTFSYLIKPDGWIVPNEKFWIDNGFTQERSESQGTSIEEVLSVFIDSVNQCDALISHNMEFDHNVVGAEMIRASIRANPDRKPKKICTKEVSTDICKLPGNYGYKWPKLTELYQFLFGKNFEGGHDALNDVIACAECFFELRRKYGI